MIKKHSCEEWKELQRQYETKLAKLKAGKMSKNKFMMFFRKEKNPYAEYEISKLYRTGTIFSEDIETADYLRWCAMEDGNIEAGFEILQLPIGSIGEDIYGRGCRCDAAEMCVSNYDRFAENIDKRNMDDKEFLAEAKKRSKNHPEIAAGIAAYYYCIDKTAEFRRWAERCPPSFDPYLGYMRARNELCEYGRNRDEKLLSSALARLIDSSETYWRASFELGILYFEGLLVKNDMRKALDYFIKAAEEGCNSDLTHFLMFFLDLEDDDTPGREEKKAKRFVGFDGFSKRPFNHPDIYAEPEWWVLSELIEYGIHNGTDFHKRFNKYGGYENDFFCIRPYNWGTGNEIKDMEIGEMPNLLIKPVNFECEWYHNYPNAGRTNQKVNTTEMRRILRMCIFSMLEDNRKEYAARNGGVADV